MQHVALRNRHLQTNNIEQGSWLKMRNSIETRSGDDGGEVVGSIEQWDVPCVSCF